MEITCHASYAVLVLITYVIREGSDEAAHLHNLNRTFMAPHSKYTHGRCRLKSNWASTQQILSLGFLTKRDLYQSHQLHMRIKRIVGLFCLVALRPKSTAMVMAGQSVHLTTLFLGKLEQAVIQYFVLILSLVTDNNPS